MVSKGLKGLLVEGRIVVLNHKLDGHGSGDCNVVGYHEELIIVVSLRLDELTVNYGSGSRVDEASVVLDEEALVELLVDEAIDELCVLILGELTKGSQDGGNLNFVALVHHRRASESVAIDDDLFGHPLVLLAVVIAGHLYPFLHEFSPQSARFNFLLVLAHSASKELPAHLDLVDIRKALRQACRVGCN